ncbi:MAG: acyl carrier protein [Syntrophaceae bacterium]
MEPLVKIKKEVRNFILENFLPEKELSDDDSLLETGVIDSTGILEIVSFIQNTCGFIFEDEDLIPDNLDSIEKIAAFVTRKLAALENYDMAAQN